MASVSFVIALYNPASRARPRQVYAAFELWRRHRASRSWVALARAVGTADERLSVCSLAEVDPAAADMRMLIIVGTESTRLLPRDNGAPWLYTPRSIDVPDR